MEPIKNEVAVMFSGGIDSLLAAVLVDLGAFFTDPNALKAITLYGFLLIVLRAILKAAPALLQKEANEEVSG